MGPVRLPALPVELTRGFPCVTDSDFVQVSTVTVTCIFVSYSKPVMMALHLRFPRDQGRDSQLSESPSNAMFPFQKILCDWHGWAGCRDGGGPSKNKDACGHVLSRSQDTHRRALGIPVHGEFLVLSGVLQGSHVLHTPRRERAKARTRPSHPGARMCSME